MDPAPNQFNSTLGSPLQRPAPPLFRVVIFYGLIILLAGQMLFSELVEKANRITEMILTTLKPTI